jgi:EAL domain-containing protein (putative c-di-GMP-specific phosphodiesterase class I)
MRPYSARTPSRWRLLVFLGMPSLLLFTWTVLETFGFHHPVLDLGVSVIVLAGVPLNWAGAWLMRRRARAADNETRARIQQLIATKSLVTVFQPIVDSRTWTPIGAEALSRFPNVSPNVSPDVWFSQADRVGLGSELELLAAELALRAACRLPEHLYVSINLSPAAILTGRLTQAIKRASVNPARLVLEITEHAVIEDYAALAEVLVDRRAGLRLAVDDAGAGYASFRHILALAPDYIKLDRSLVTGIDTDPDRRALTSALTAFAGAIGAKVIAEGVETTEELHTVAALGVQAAQGYLTGRPATPDAWTSNAGAPLVRA